MRDFASSDEEAKESLAPVEAEEATRYTVFSGDNALVRDATLGDVDVDWMEPKAKTFWLQRNGDAGNAVGNVQLQGYKSRERARIGKGHAWESVLVPAPVLVDGVLYAMDAYGYISAHSVADIDKRFWVSKVAITGDDEEVLGGGLAVAGGQLFVTTGQGKVLAINASDGSLIWEKTLYTPVRSAPKLQRGTVYVMTVDDQVFALDSANGSISWKHRGIGERVSFLSAISPSLADNYLVAAYSSGELYGLAAETGQELWNDSLASAQKTSASAEFTGFGGDPVLAGGVAFASSKNRMMAATHVFTGRRIWEQEIAAHDVPWLSGNFLFVLTPEAQVAAVYARDGRIKWVYDLPRYAKAEKQLEPYHWQGPIGINDQLVIFGEHGKAIALSPQTGEQVAVHKIPDGVRSRPVIAGGVMYLVGSDATLHTLY